jgi:NADH-quinone oxidoreductase subunit L
MDQTLIKLIPLFPLIGFALLGTVGKKLPRAVAGGLATGFVAISFACALALFARFLGLPGEERHVVAPVFSWMSIPAATAGGHSLDIAVSFMLDPLSMTMTLIITGIGALIHFYAMGYMAHDTR